MVVIFYLSKLLFSSFLQFEGNFVHGQNKNTMTELYYRQLILSQLL